MADAVVEFGVNTSRFKRDLDTVERDAKRTASEIERSFRLAEARGFGMGGDARTQRAQRLAAERDIHQRIEADNRASLARQVGDYAAHQETLTRRTRVFAERQQRVWEASEQRRARMMRVGAEAGRGAALGVAAAFAIAYAEASRYADRYEYIGDVMRRTNREAERARDVLGRDLVSAFQGIDGVLGRVVGGLSEFHSGLTDAIANAAHLDTMYSARRAATLDRLEGTEMARRRDAAFARESLGITARGTGPEAEAARNRIEREQYAARINGLVGEGKLTSSQAGDLVAKFAASQGSRDSGDGGAAQRADRSALLEIANRFDETTAMRIRAGGDEYGARAYELRAGAAAEIERLPGELSASRRRQAIDSINARRDAAISAVMAERDAERQADEERRRDRATMYEQRMEQHRVDELAASGRAREAASAREQLRYEREVLEIRRDQLLTDEQRTRYLSEAETRHEDIVGRLDDTREGRRIRGLTAGVGGDRLLRHQVLGAGVNVQKMQLTEAKIANRHLAEIVDKVGVYG